MSTIWQILSGAALGAITGLLIGLSVSPVVATVLGSITAALGALLGFQNANEAAARGSDVRLAFFGFSCAIALFVGLYLRTHNSLSPKRPEVTSASLDREFKIWRSLPGISDEQASSLVIYRYLNIVPSSMQIGGVAPEATEQVRAANTFLFAAKRSGNVECNYFDPGYFADDEVRSKAMLRDERLHAFAKSLVKIDNAKLRDELLHSAGVLVGCLQ
jgi:hypothetical protein